MVQGNERRLEQVRKLTVKILIVDDNPELAQALSLGFRLQWPDCQVIAAESGERALVLFPTENPDIILLDIAMPGMDGFEVLCHIREVSDVPIIILTVKGEEQDKVRALDLGADDYVTKPFGPLELMARIKAVLRRAVVPVPEGSTPPIICGDLTSDYDSRGVSIRGNPVKLTPTEHRLLCALARYPNQVLSHQALLVRVWGAEYRGERNFLKVYIKRLRDKIEEDSSNPRYILAEWGRGYRLTIH
ncbi:MAG: response regulator transcription factor [Chloroflexota bacterium]